MKNFVARLAVAGLFLVPSTLLAQSTVDPQPPVAAPAGMGRSGAVYQAGVGGPTAYGRAGVIELGGSVGFNAASGVQTLAMSPNIGWFLADNFEMSALLGLQVQNVDNSSSTFFTALIEPSYHLPFNNTVFAFAGVGLGLGYLDGEGVGFAMAPRLGMNFLLGRSGILTPSAFFSYSTVGVSGSTQAPNVRVSGAYGLQIGYTIML